MATAETARLIASLELQGDKFTSGITQVNAGLNRLDSRVSKSGSFLRHTFSTALGVGLQRLAADGFGKLEGFVEGSIHKLEDFDLGLEKVTLLTGETAQSAGTLILLFNKFGLTADDVAQSAAFAEKTLGKLNATTGKTAKGAKDITSAQDAVTKAHERLNVATLKLHETESKRHSTASSRVAAENRVTDAERTLREAQVKLAASQASVGKAQAGATAPISKLVQLDKTYGLSLVDSKGKIVSYSEELSQLADLYDRHIPASTKAYVASQLFGRQYAKLAPILALGSAGLREAAKEASSLGLDLGGDTVKKMDEFRATMRSLGEQVNILQLQIGIALIPTITDAAKAFSTWLSTGGSEQIIQFFKSAGDFAREFGHAVETTVIPVFSGITKAWSALPGPLKDLLIGGVVAQKIGSFAGLNLAKLGGSALGLRGSNPGTPVYVADVAGGAGVAPVGKLGKLVSIAQKVFLVGAAVGVFAELKGVLDDQAAANRQQAADLTIQNKSFAQGASLADLEKALKGIKEEDARLTNSLSVEGAAFQFNIDGVRDAVHQQEAILEGAIRQAHEDALDGITAIKDLKKPVKTPGTSALPADPGQRQNLAELGVLRRAIAAGFKPSQAAVTATFNRDVIRAAKAQEAQARRAADAARATTETVRRGDDNIVAAIRGIPAPLVRVNVTASDISRTVVQRLRTVKNSNPRTTLTGPLP